MSYLERLAMKATGAVTHVRPRRRSRFEPPGAAGDAPLTATFDPPDLPAKDRGLALHEAHPTDPPRRFERRAGAPQETGQRTREGIAQAHDPAATAIPVDQVRPTCEAGRASDQGGRPPDTGALPAHSSESAFQAIMPAGLPAPALRSASASAEPPLARGGALRVPETAAGSVAPGARTADDALRAGTEAPSRHVHVSIGRIEVRAVAPETARKQSSAPRRPAALSLDEYLRSRGRP
jgi:hypothetical protein